MTGSMPRLSAIGITIATAAPCEFTSLEVKNRTRPYVQGCWVTTEPVLPLTMAELGIAPLAGAHTPAVVNGSKLTRLRWKAASDKMGLPADEQDQIFYRNAARMFGVEE